MDLEEGVGLTPANPSSLSFGLSSTRNKELYKLLGLFLSFIRLIFWVRGSDVGLCYCCNVCTITHSVWAMPEKREQLLILESYSYSCQMEFDSCGI